MSADVDVVGIDPGLDGALVRLTGGENATFPAAVAPMPTRMVRGVRQVDQAALEVLLIDWLLKPPMIVGVFVEHIGALRGTSNTPGAIKAGAQFGQLLGAIRAAFGEERLCVIEPFVWQNDVFGRHVAKGKTKAESKKVATSRWSLRGGDGVADAACIALYGVRNVDMLNLGLDGRGILSANQPFLMGPRKEIAMPRTNTTPAAAAGIVAIMAPTDGSGEGRFNGVELEVLMVDGRPAWKTKEIGRALGYADNGRRLVSTVGTRWADELIDGVDKGVTTVVTPGGKQQMAVLFESGVHLVCAKTNKPVGKQLRRWLSDRALAPVATHEGPSAPTLDLATTEYHSGKAISESYFNGAKLEVLMVDGRPAWKTKEIGRALGYADNGRRLVSTIGADWSDELLEGIDRTITSSVMGGGKQQVAVLFESGVHLVCAKTNKPVGKQLRRWLADRVLPSIAETGGYPANPVALSVMDGAAALRAERAFLLEMKRLDMEASRRSDELEKLRLENSHEERMFRLRAKAKGSRKKGRRGGNRGARTQPRLSASRVAVLSPHNTAATPKTTDEMRTDGWHSAIGLARMTGLTQDQLIFVSREMRLLNDESPANPYVRCCWVKGRSGVTVRVFFSDRARKPLKAVAELHSDGHSLASAASAVYSRANRGED